ncbi:MAG: ADP-ribosylglycohydrolase family protein, partial [Gordonia sp. (in: high G+C Gram-positive bacteria)]
VAALTHPHEYAQDSCVLWCDAIRGAVADEWIDVYAGLDLIPARRREFWAEQLDAARDGDPRDFSPNGYTVHALQAAASAVLHASGDGPDHFRDGVFTAVRIGNDTDTVAAIAGALLGAQWGLSAIDDQWRVAVHGWPHVDTVPSRAADLVRLADEMVGVR